VQFDADASFRFENGCLFLYFLHPLLMIGVKLVHFLLLFVGARKNILKWEEVVDGDVLDAGHIEAPSFLQGFSDKTGYSPRFEDVHDLFGTILALFDGLFRLDGVLVDLLAKFTHALLALFDFVDEWGQNIIHVSFWNLILLGL
jgi:hypothetical protein